jgi:hypothetical protein
VDSALVYFTSLNPSWAWATGTMASTTADAATTVFAANAHVSGGASTHQAEPDTRARRPHVLVRGLGDFSLHFKAGPAGGRLRRPSSAGSTHQRRLN